MGKYKSFKFMGFLNISGEAEIHTIPKTWEKWISIVRPKYKNTNIIRLCFLNISHEAKIHTISITWERWILIVRETYGKMQTLKSYGFLTYFMWGINPYNFQNIEKVNSLGKGKIWGNTNVSKLRVLKFFAWSRNPNHRKSGFP